MGVVGGLLVIALVMTQGNSTTAEITTTLTLFVAAFYRLMPSLHRMFSSFSGLQFNKAILNDLSASMLASDDQRLQENKINIVEMPFKEEIVLKNKARLVPE